VRDRAVEVVGPPTEDRGPDLAAEEHRDRAPGRDCHPAPIGIASLLVGLTVLWIVVNPHPHGCHVAPQGSDRAWSARRTVHPLAVHLRGAADWDCSGSPITLGIPRRRRSGHRQLGSTGPAPDPRRFD
jgi:hypothetical protein